MQSENDQIMAHIQGLVAGRVLLSPIYAFLLSDVRVISATKGSMKARLQLMQKHMNSGGGIHGSTSATIVDWAGGMAIATWDLREKTGVSLDIHITYVSSAKEGDEVEIEATVDKVGGSVAFTKVVISKVVDGVAGPVVASGSHTKYVKQRPA
ncbi:acyl-coenzyme A thioesteras-like protein 13 [Pseudomassariella vexata]|uniref:Acyl-coenzyme A thioesteras-like protein 13 n=1 Tax=Pseudomassariella vexata TaxID=1141098 RepID=A0A1Y2DRG5_9PEZI|nr:acyl-coenzyme A thioesteras-like protein 13 [Pseudomassariella vexata]ORY61779.1 acyl-coenzyme A thioesteras-like protein 13 [Pseudomassariella vexata]